MTRVRLVDVARAAEVSTASVSNALNGTGRMSAATRERIRSIAEAVGYRRPSNRILALRVTTYGDKPWNYAKVPYYAHTIAAGTAAAHARGYGLTVVPATAGGDAWRHLTADGVILIDPPKQDPIATSLTLAKMPLVFAGRPVD